MEREHNLPRLLTAATTTHRESKQHLGSDHNERFAEVADHLSPQQVEVLGRGGGVDHRHVHVVPVHALLFAVTHLSDDEDESANHQRPDSVVRTTVKRSRREFSRFQRRHCRAHLKETLHTAGGVFRSRAVVAVGQQDHHPTLEQPLGLACNKVHSWWTQVSSRPL